MITPEEALLQASLYAAWGLVIAFLWKWKKVPLGFSIVGLSAIWGVLTFSGIVLDNYLPALPILLLDTLIRTLVTAGALFMGGRTGSWIGDEIITHKKP